MGTDQRRSGRRHEWAELPDVTVAAVREHTGRIDQAEATDSGFSSQIAATLHTEQGRVFVKGMRQDHEDAWTQTREAAVNPFVVPLSPKMLWRVAAGGWDLIGFEHVAGRGADHRPSSADLPLVVDAITAIGEISCPDLKLETARRRWGRYLEDRSDAVAFAGDALVHSDWNPGNMVITDSGAVHVVDWPWATRGAAWIDTACWVVWLVFAGHSPHEAERWAAKVPAWSAASAHALDLFATVQTRYWESAADKHSNKWTRRLRDSAARWALHRGVWPH